MGQPLSLIFSYIHMVKMENDVVTPSKPIFYCRVVDEIHSRRKLGDNILFHRLNNCHTNIKLTIELNPSKFLDVKLTISHGAYKFNVYRINKKLSSPWTSKTTKRYKRNKINGDIHHSKRISCKLRCRIHSE